MASAFSVRPTNAWRSNDNHSVRECVAFGGGLVPETALQHAEDWRLITAPHRETIRNRIEPVRSGREPAGIAALVFTLAPSSCRALSKALIAAVDMQRAWQPCDQYL